MDPKATIVLLFNALQYGNHEDVKSLADDLVRWLLGGGFYPTNIGLLTGLFGLGPMGQEHEETWLRMTVVNCMRWPEVALTQVRAVRKAGNGPPPASRCRCPELDMDGSAYDGECTSSYCCNKMSLAEAIDALAGETGCPECPACSP